MSTPAQRYDRDDAEYGDDGDVAPPGVVENLQAIAQYDGNLADLLESETLQLLGVETSAEYDMDVTSRSVWHEGYLRAVKAAKQEPAEKDYPFKRAANVKYPILTSACVQFNARAMPAITRSDQPVTCKPQGADPDGMKAAKAQRLASFHNHQLMRVCEEWEIGTDKLTMTLPLGGSGFRKSYWSREMGRPVMDFLTPDKIVVPNDAASFARAPRLTQPAIYYPYEIRRLVERGDWRGHDWQRAGGSDTQRPVEYLEQQRYIDMDGDGLQEPYIVTLHKETQAVVRIEAGFDIEGLKISADDEVDLIVRESPLTAYYFLPSMDESIYGMGFGQLLESLGGAVNTALNQILDAAHRQNTGGGFIAQGMRMRGGEMKIRPAEYKFINAPGGDIRNAIHDITFPGPSQVLFQTMEFLLGASQDITAVKDILTGEAPSGQAMGATLALIEQGLSVVSTIYTRMFRAMRHELQRQMKLNRWHLDPRIYAEFLDDPSLLDALLKKTGSVAAAMGALGAVQSGANAQAGQPAPMPGMPGQMGQQPAQPPAEWTPKALDALMEDFDLKSMDVALGADPKSMTDMQRMMRSEYLTQFEGKPGINTQAIFKRKMEAANIENPQELFAQGPDPMQETMVAKEKSEIAVNESTSVLNKAKATETMNKAESVRQDGMEKAFERGIRQGEGPLPGGVGGMEDAADGGAIPGGAGADAGGGGGAVE